MASPNTTTIKKTGSKGASTGHITRSLSPRVSALYGIIVELSGSKLNKKHLKSKLFKDPNFVLKDTDQIWELLKSLAPKSIGAASEKGLLTTHNFACLINLFYEDTEKNSDYKVLFYNLLGLTTIAQANNPSFIDNLPVKKQINDTIKPFAEELRAAKPQKSSATKLTQLDTTSKAIENQANKLTKDDQHMASRTKDTATNTPPLEERPKFGRSMLKWLVGGIILTGGLAAVLITHGGALPFLMKNPIASGMVQTLGSTIGRYATMVLFSTPLLVGSLFTGLVSNAIKFMRWSQTKNAAINRIAEKYHAENRESYRDVNHVNSENFSNKAKVSTPRAASTQPDPDLISQEAVSPKA